MRFRRRQERSQLPKACALPEAVDGKPNMGNVCELMQLTCRGQSIEDLIRQCSKETLDCYLEHMEKAGCKLD